MPRSVNELRPLSVKNGKTSSKVKAKNKNQIHPSTLLCISPFTHLQVRIAKEVVEVGDGLA